MDSYPYTERYFQVLSSCVFQSGLSTNNVLRHMLRLIWYIHPKLQQDKLTKLMETIKPNIGVNFRVPDKKGY